MDAEKMARLEELRAKEELTEEEKVELAALEAELTPVAEVATE